MKHHAILWFPLRFWGSIWGSLWPLAFGVPRWGWVPLDRKKRTKVSLYSTLHACTRLWKFHGGERVSRNSKDSHSELGRMDKMRFATDLLGTLQKRSDRAFYKRAKISMIYSFKKAWRTNVIV